MIGDSHSTRTLARIALSLTVAVTSLALAAGSGAAAPLSVDATQSDALASGDSVACDGCVCLGDLADKLGAECIHLDGGVATASPDVTAAESPSCVSCVPECAEQVVESRGKDLACPA